MRYIQLDSREYDGTSALYDGETGEFYPHSVSGSTRPEMALSPVLAKSVISCSRFTIYVPNRNEICKSVFDVYNNLFCQFMKQ